MADPSKANIDWAAVARHDVAAHNEAKDDRLDAARRIGSTRRLIHELAIAGRMPSNVADLLNRSLSAGAPGGTSPRSLYAGETSQQRELAETIAELAATLARARTASHTLAHRADVLVELARSVLHLSTYFDDLSPWPADVAEQNRAMMEKTSTVLHNSVTVLLRGGRVPVSPNTPTASEETSASHDGEQSSGHAGPDLRQA
ncbi:hypothetical protein AB0C27_50870 [Nonomuraea sp. NPDC048882]|uniref:hypothetical protein n=1 Tax=Nonomuraea sp. NPDC048882 TaxID=3154347 RepID=UPI00340FDAB7